jgi:CheY-like chemotaxis protein
MHQSPVTDSASSARILIVDDIPEIRTLVRSVLADAGHQVVEAGGVDSALDHLRSRPVDVVLTDVHMPGRSGLELARLVARDFPATIVIVMSATDNGYLTQMTRELKIEAVLEKPMTPEVLLEAMSAAMERRATPRAA